MSQNDPEISDLLNELDSLKDAENEVEYSFYGQQVIGHFDMVSRLLRDIPNSLKKKYSYPFKLSTDGSTYIITKDGFQIGNTVLKIVQKDGQNALQIEDNGKNMTATHDERVRSITELKTHASAIGKLCVVFKKRLKEEIVEAQKVLKRKIEEF